MDIENVVSVGIEIWHGKNVLFWKNVGKSRVVGVRERIFIPNLSQKNKGFGAVTWLEEKDNFARSRGEINLVGFLVVVWYNKRKYHFCIKGE